MHRYGCHNKNDLNPPGNPVLCKPESFQLHLRNVKCCSNSNYCNQDPRAAKPTLGPQIYHPGKWWSQREADDVLTVCLLLLFFLLTPQTHQLILLYIFKLCLGKVVHKTSEMVPLLHFFIYFFPGQEVRTVS